MAQCPKPLYFLHIALSVAYALLTPFYGGLGGDSIIHVHQGQITGIALWGTVPIFNGLSIRYWESEYGSPLGQLGTGYITNNCASFTLSNTSNENINGYRIIYDMVFPRFIGFHTSDNNTYVCNISSPLMNSLTNLIDTNWIIYENSYLVGFRAKTGAVIDSISFIFDSNYNPLQLFKTGRLGGPGGIWYDEQFDKGRINAITDWGHTALTANNYGDGVQIQGWRSDNFNSTLGYGADPPAKACTAFTLTANEYINGYRIKWNVLVRYIGFHTSLNMTHECQSSARMLLDLWNDTGWKMVKDDAYLSGFWVVYGGVIDSLGLQFTIPVLPQSPTFDTTQPTQSPTNIPTIPIVTTFPTPMYYSTQISTTQIPTTQIPTPLDPTGIRSTALPTISPSETNAFPGVIRSIFSDSYFEIHIHLNVTAIRPLVASLCIEIFDTNTNAVLQNSICSWNPILKTIIIILSSSSTIQINDTMTIKNDAFEWSDDNIHFFRLHQQQSCNVEAGANPKYPKISLINPPMHEIGVCDPLLLDASATQWLGGRAAEQIEWEIMINGVVTYRFNDTYIVEIESNDMNPGSIILYTVNVTSWYGLSSYYASDVIIKSDNPIPQLLLSGPAIFDANTERIVIEGLVSFIDSCLNNNGMDELSLVYSWSVESNNVTVTDGEVMDNAKYMQLRSFISQQTGNYINLDRNTLLQKGVSYVFKVNVQCLGRYNCFVSDTLSLIYKYSEIQCQISGGNRNIDVQIAEIGSLRLQLIGNEWTYDPDHNVLVYQWGWDCSHCNHIISSQLSLPVINISFNDSIGVYLYQFMLTVMDANVLSRETCQSMIEIQLNVTKETTAIMPSVIVTISSTATQINVNDRLRLIGDVKYITGAGLEQNTLNNLNYEWTEITNKLTTRDINRYRVNDENSIYLVLESNSLQPGLFYEFELFIDSNDNYIQSGKASIVIYVKSPPLIIDNSLQTNPICNVQFNSFIDSLTYFVDISAKAEGDNVPLTYNFDLEIELTNDINTSIIYLHSYPLTESYLKNVILPIHCGFDLLFHVTDFEGATASDSIACCTQILNNNNCFSYNSDIIENFIVSEIKTNSEINRHIFQTSMSLLNYLSNIVDKDCAYNNFKQVMDLLVSRYDSLLFDFCDENNLFVIQLSQILSLWFNVAVENEQFMDELFENANMDYFASIYDLLTQSLDPCHTLRSIQSLNDLSVSEISVTTNKAIVLFNDSDITSLLSPMIINGDNFYLLYNLINNVVDFISMYSLIDSDIIASSEIPIKGMVSFIEKVLYLSGLTSLSTSITTEIFNTTFDNFELLTIRHDNDTLTTIINDITLTLNTGNSNSDIILFGISVNSTSNVSYSGENSDECLSNVGTLHGKEISVTVLDLQNSSETEIILIFHNVSPDDNVACVWYNELTQKWDSNGCVTTYYTDKGEIWCQCTHLTTFATIRGLTNECKNDNLLALFQNDLFVTLNTLFAVVFLCIVCWTLFHIIRLKVLRIQNLFKRVQIRVITLIAVIASIQCLTCLELYILSEDNNHNSHGSESYHISLLTILILLPLPFYYVLFTMILFSWINIAYAMKGKVALVRNVKTSLKILNGLICALFILIIILLLIPANNATTYSLQIGEIVWCLLMSMSSILFLFYGLKVLCLVRRSNKMVINNNTSGFKGARDAEYKLIFIIGVLTLFFIIQSGLTIYFAHYTSNLNIYWRSFDVATHFICLLALCIIYRQNILRLSENVSFFSKVPKTTITGTSLNRINSQSTTRTALNSTGTGTDGLQMIQRRTQMSSESGCAVYDGIDNEFSANTPKNTTDLETQSNGHGENNNGTDILEPQKTNINDETQDKMYDVVMKKTK